MDYKQKYLKYKQKYLELRNQLGGQIDVSIENQRELNNTIPIELEDLIPGTVYILYDIATRKLFRMKPFKRISPMSNRPEFGNPGESIHYNPDNKLFFEEKTLADDGIPLPP